MNTYTRFLESEENIFSIIICEILYRELATFIIAHIFIYLISSATNLERIYGYSNHPQPPSSE